MLFLLPGIWVGFSYILTLSFDGFCLENCYEFKINPIYWVVATILFGALFFVVRYALRAANEKGGK